MLCPKGVNRYLQGSHPDRLLTAYRRDPSAPSGFRPAEYEEAIARVASEIDRIQTTYGPDAFALSQRGEPDDREGYLLGKFARVCLKTPQHRLQRPAVHGQRRGGQQEGVRHRPRRQPVERHPRGRGHLDQRRERRRVRADHDELHLAGPRERGQDHRRRSAHHAAGPHLRPVPAGQARPRRRPVHRHPAPDDRERLARPRLHPPPHRRLRGGCRGTSREWTPQQDGRGDRHRRDGDPPGGRVVGHGEDQLPAARPRHRAAQPRRAELPRRDQHRAGVGADRREPAAATRRSPARATARAAASTARSATSFPGARDIENPEHRAHVAGVWGIDPEELPARRRRCLRDVPQDRPGRDQRAALRSASTRSSRCRTTTSSRGCWRSWSSTSRSTSS